MEAADTRIGENVLGLPNEQLMQVEVTGADVEVIGGDTGRGLPSFPGAVPTVSPLPTMQPQAKGLFEEAAGQPAIPALRYPPFAVQ